MSETETKSNEQPQSTLFRRISVCVAIASVLGLAAVFAVSEMTVHSLRESLAVQYPNESPVVREIVATFPREDYRSAWLLLILPCCIGALAGVLWRRPLIQRILAVALILFVPTSYALAEYFQAQVIERMVPQMIEHVRSVSR